MLLGEEFPNLSVETTKGEYRLHDIFRRHRMTLLMSHPADFTPVCTTEMAAALRLYPEFRDRGIELLGMSVDGLDSHRAWVDDILAYSGCRIKSANDMFPIVALRREDASLLGILDPNEVNEKGMPLTARTVFFVGNDSRLRASILYPATSGRSFKEVLRVTDSLLLTEKNNFMATPVEWVVGSAVCVPPHADMELVDKYKQENSLELKVVDLPSRRNYLRFLKR